MTKNLAEQAHAALELREECKTEKNNGRPPLRLTVDAKKARTKVLRKFNRAAKKLK